MPTELAGLGQLRELNLFGNSIQHGWGHLPRQLLTLDLTACSLQRVPAELAGLGQLTHITLSFNFNIQGGWEHLPQALQRLDLFGCGLQQEPAELADRQLQVLGV